MACGVYKITCVNGRTYIGSAVDIVKRWGEHTSALVRGRHHNSKLQRAWSKYGPDAFAFEVMLECSADLLLFFEQHEMDRTSPWFNIALFAGAPTRGSKMSAETKAKIGAANRGRGKGRRLTEEHKAKIAVACRRPCSAETRAKIGLANKGKGGACRDKAELVRVAKKNWDNTEYRAKMLIVLYSNAQNRRKTI